MHSVPCRKQTRRQLSGVCTTTHLAGPLVIAIQLIDLTARRETLEKKGYEGRVLELLDVLQHVACIAFSNWSTKIDPNDNPGKSVMTKP